MKKFLLLFLIAPSCISAQSFNGASLDINNVKARINSAGDLFWDFNGPKFEVPAGSGDHAIFTGNLWVGGLDGGGQLHVAAQMYRQSGDDFFQGPMMNASNYSTTQDNLWNRVWKINRTTIDSFRLGLFTGTPQIILDWPGNGNTSLGQAASLAPFKDVNNNGLYEPSAGDYPCIKGDQAIYFIFNDDRNVHTESGGNKFGIEIHGMAYAFNNSSYPHLNNTIFIHYRIFNRSQATYNNVYLGNWTDFDLGDWGDDFIGSNVDGQYYYIYNGDNMDGTGGPGTYGVSPPAEGVLFLKGPVADPGDGIDNDKDCLVDEPNEDILMTKSMYYNNDFSVLGNPGAADDFYTFLKGQWKDSTSLTYGGGGYGGVTPCDYMYPGASDQVYSWGTGGNCAAPQTLQPPWDEITNGNTPADRRGMGSSGPFTFSPGEELCVEYAYVFAQGTNGNLSSVILLETAADTIRDYYNSNLDTCGCIDQPVGIGENILSYQVSVYPNPANDVLTFQASSLGSIQWEVVDLAGRTIMHGKANESKFEISVRELEPGCYITKIRNEKGTGSVIFVKR